MAYPLWLLAAKSIFHQVDFGVESIFLSTAVLKNGHFEMLFRI